MKFLGEDVTFKENLQFSLKRYLVWWLILLVTIVFDYLTTILFITHSGIEAEANVVIRLLIGLLGLYPGLLIGKLLQLVAVVIVVGLHQRLGNLFLLIVIVLNCWAVVMNTF